MNIAFVGAGAVGGVIAWHLARAGADPLIVARPATAALLAAEGLTVVHAGGEERVRVRVTADPAAAGPCDLVVGGMKAQDWPVALPLVVPLLGPDTVVLPLLNGIPWWYFHGAGGAHEGRRVEAVDPDGVLSATIPSQKIVGGVVHMGGTRETPARIRWNGRHRLAIGEAGGRVTPRVERIAQLLRSAGLDAPACDEIRREIWLKLLGNANFNPLSVLTGANMGRMVEHPPLRRVVRAIMAEVVAVARGVGIDLDIDLDRRMAINPQMRDFRTSMFDDFHAGRPLETGAIVEAVVELGRLGNVPTPMLETIGALVAERARNR